MGIAQLRKGIDKIDAKIVSLICMRQKCVRKIALLKKQGHIPALDAKREIQIISNAVKNAGKDLDPKAVKMLYEKVIFPCSYKVHKHVRNKKAD